MMGYKKPSYLGASEENYQMNRSFEISGLRIAYDNLKKEHKKLKKNQVAPYCNSCLSQDVDVLKRTVYCNNCGTKFPFKEIKK